MSEAPKADCDILIVGSGAAGLTAAVAAAAAGLRPLVVEKAACWGGTSALSGGGLWIPANHFMQADGDTDTFEEALNYLSHAVPADEPWTSRERQAAFLRQGPEMIRLLEAQGVRLRRDAAHPDFYSALPSSRVGRMLEPEIFDTNKLGSWRETQRPGPMPYVLRIDETKKLNSGFHGFSSFAMMVFIFARHHLMRLLGKRLVSVGASLAAQLMAAAQRLGVPVRLNAPLRELLVEDRRVIGGVIEENGARREIRARFGVLLAAGGFARGGAFREAHQGLTGEYSSASPDDTGDAIKLADSVGAATAMLDDSWWGPTLMYPGGIPGFMVSERTLPGSLMVNGSAQRFTDESQSYNDIGHDFLAKGLDDPTWLIIDSRCRRRYLFGGLLPGQTPQALFDTGFFLKADTIEELAAKCGLNAASLRATVDRFNRFADTGVDEDFKRGSTVYDNHWGDPLNKPNPNLGRVDEPPFLAARVRLGDLGTKGGYVTDEYARVLRPDGGVIEGLYAAGNSSASVMGHRYPGPGATLGPATTFGFIAARHMAQRASNQA